jgi:hypothetical protein
MDPRERKARELAEREQIVFRNGAWWVPSQTNNTKHRVEIDGLFVQGFRTAREGL